MNKELLDYNPILNLINLSLPLHSVLCTETGRVLCFTNHIKTAFDISSERNRKLWRNVHLTHKISSAVNLNLPQNFIFHISSQTFKKKILSAENSYKYILISERAAALDELHKFLEYDSVEDECIPDFLIDARKEENESMRKRYSLFLSRAKTLKEINDLYDELRREACVYGNF
jgi:hypothetical protein